MSRTARPTEHLPFTCSPQDLTIIGYDVGFPDNCCLDTEFCFVNSAFQLKCCAIGNDCASINLCSNTSQYYCNTTISKTASTTAHHSSTTPSLSGSHSITKPPSTSTSDPNVITTPACCVRPCNAYSEFQCAESLGGICCSLGMTCVTNSCVANLPSSQSSSSSVPSCAATTDIPCTDGLGGCCNPDSYCTVSQSTGYCGSGTAAPSALRTGGALVGGIVQTTPGGGGLSTGAKAGIGAGVAIGALVVLGALIWWWMARRRQAVSGSVPQGSSAPRGTETVVSTQHGGSTPGTREMVGRGTEDYFGPAAVAGPFTAARGAGAARGTGRGAVPLSPDEPGDIRPAVEIGEGMERPAVSPGEPTGPHEYWRNGATALNEHVELP